MLDVGILFEGFDVGNKHQALQDGMLPQKKIGMFKQGQQTRRLFFDQNSWFKTHATPV